MTPRFRILSAATFLLGLAIPTAYALSQTPMWLDEEYRQCVLTAIDREMDQKIDLQREYGDSQVSDLETYKDDLHEAWQIADEGSRRDAIRDADSRYRDATRQSKRDFDRISREIRTESAAAQRECRANFNENKRYVRNLCYSTSDCSGSRVCSTERGVCESACPPNAEFCPQVCAGTCERSSSSRSSSSRSSTTGGLSGPGQACRTVSDCPSGYLCSTVISDCTFGGACGVCLRRNTSDTTFSSSSRSSSGNIGLNCQPYTCPDGRSVPACDENGNLINYTSNPCYS